MIFIPVVAVARDRVGEDEARINSVLPGNEFLLNVRIVKARGEVERSVVATVEAEFLREHLVAIEGM